MQIAIAERLKGFVHRPGVRALIPGSSLVAEAYPARLEFYDLGESTPCGEVALTLEGAGEHFTLEQDLERGHLKIFSSFGRKLFRVSLSACEGGVLLLVDKLPYPMAFQSRWRGVEANGALAIGEPVRFGAPLGEPLNFSTLLGERLSFGSSKALNWDCVSGREEMREILPYWFRLGGMAPSLSSAKIPSSTLLSSLDAAIAERRRSDLIPSLRNLYRAGFGELMVPSCVDEHHLGFSLPPLSKESSPLLLLSAGAQLIRSILIDERDGALSLLPLLPHDLPCGRLIRAATSFGELDMEWSCGRMRRCFLNPTLSTELLLDLPKEIRHFRVRYLPHGSGRKVDAGTPFPVFQGRRVFIDRFEK